MSYSSYVVVQINEKIAEYDSLRQFANTIGVDPGIISRVRNGKYIPKPKTYLKWFPDETDVVNSMQDDTKESVVEKITIIEPKDMKDLKAQLKLLGYEIIIKKIGSK